MCLLIRQFPSRPHFGRGFLVSRLSVANRDLVVRLAALVHLMRPASYHRGGGVYKL